MGISQQVLRHIGLLARLAGGGGRKLAILGTGDMTTVTFVEWLYGLCKPIGWSRDGKEQGPCRLHLFYQWQT